jgi:hypothetical protein
VELAIATFSALFSGATAVASGVSTAVSAVGSAVGLSSTTLSVLQGVATAGSILSAGVAGVTGYVEGQQNAAFARIEGNAERLASQEQSLRIRRDLVQKVGAARVAFAGSGLSIGSGSQAEDVEDDLRDQADFELGLEKANRTYRAASAQIKAQNAETQGFTSLVGGVGRGLMQFADYKLDLAKRG